MNERVKRRLTTVLCADVAGYSRLMEADEAGTMVMLRRYREAMRALVARHDGRVVNTWGDAVIAEFASVVEAVQCAVEVQQELAGHDRDLPDDKRMRFRIGINLGDVLTEGEDIYGDGVNIAARLQEQAEPGGILISGPVYDQVHNKLAIGFDYIGQQQVKNMTTPVMSYRVRLSGAGDVGTAATSKPGSGRPGPPPIPDTGLPQGSLTPAGLWARFMGLPRKARVLAAAAALLFHNQPVHRLQDDLVPLANCGVVVRHPVAPHPRPQFRALTAIDP